MSDETRFVCLKCRVTTPIDELREVEEYHSYFVCPDCEGTDFVKAPPEEAQSEGSDD